MKFKKYAIIDLEWLAWKGSIKRNWSLSYEKQKIIEFGIVTFNNFYNKNISRHVFLFEEKNLPEYFKNLTGISQFLINAKGQKFKQNFLTISRILSSCNIIYCNGIDDKIIIKNLHFNKMPKPLFLKKIFNIEKILMKALNSKSHVTSSNLSNIFKYKDKDKKSKKHRAVDDASNIYFALKKLIDENKISLSDLLL